MNPEQHVCSLELAQCLKTLGTAQESFFVWTQWYGRGQWQIKLRPCNRNYADSIAAFTASELADMLPEVWHIVSLRYGNGRYGIGTHEVPDDATCVCEGDTLADAYAVLILTLVERGYLVAQKGQFVPSPPAMEREPHHEWIRGVPKESKEHV